MNDAHVIRMLSGLIRNREEWLMESILAYAVQYGYAQYTSTLKESWRMSISGLSESILASLQAGTPVLDLGPDNDYARDPVAAFGILEGRLHRERGIDIGMFLGLLKYYRQSYTDLLGESDFPRDAADWGRQYLERCFDRIEIGLCSEWIRGSDAQRIRELQVANRSITNDKNKYLTLFESLANPVMLLDRDNLVENLNQATAIMLAASGNRYYAAAISEDVKNAEATSVIGQPADRVLPWLADELRRFTAEALPGLECEKTCDIAGEERWYRTSFSRMLDVSDKFSGTLLIFTDETRQKRTETSLTLAKTAAESAQQAAESANLAKSAFLANMSHELRTPLNAILGFTQVIGRSRSLDEENRDSLRTIRRNGEHLLTLINQVLDLSKIEAGRLTLNEKPCDLYALLDDLEDMFALKAQQKDLHLFFEREAHVPQYVEADEVKLRQVLMNLLNNAVKFTTDGGAAVYVTAERVSADTASQRITLYFNIEDSGPGIPADELPLLFGAFSQTSSGRGSQEGTGLGLAISRKFIQLMGGDIRAASTPGKGAGFRFDIRCALAKADDIRRTTTGRQVVALQPGQPRQRILIVDDKADNRRLLIKLLQPLGFELAEAENGRQAVEQWIAWQPRLILMDLRMPVLDGYAAAERIRSLPGGNASKIVILSASSLGNELHLARSRGCDDFLRKPFRAGEIFALVERQLNVSFVYEDPDSDTGEAAARVDVVPLTPDALTGLPDALREDVHNAALQGSEEAMDAVITQIAAINPELARTLRHITDAFEFGKIIHAIQQTRSERHA